MCLGLGGNWQEGREKLSSPVFGETAQKTSSAGCLGSIRMKGTGQRGRGRFQAHGAQYFQHTFGNDSE